MQVQYIHQSCPASLSALRHVHVYLGTAARRRCRLLREIPPKGFPTCLGLQRELTSSNFKLLEYPRKKERSPCSVSRLDGWVAGSLLVTKEGCRILEDSNMWCSSSLEILFWVSMRRRRRHHIGLLSWRVIGGRECGRSGAEHGSKLVNGSRVGQVGPVDSCGEVRDLDLSLLKSCNLSWVGQVRPIDSCGQVGDLYPHPW